jgi:flagellar biosynthesis/type III secretory pathway protein FliH
MLGIRTILGETPPDDLMRRLVHRALEQVQTPGSLTVHVHSDDTGAAAQAISSLSGSDSTTIRIVADPRLVRASCRIESEFGSIEAGLASQLDAIESALSTLARERGLDRPASDPNSEAGPE